MNATFGSKSGNRPAAAPFRVAMRLLLCLGMMASVILISGCKSLAGPEYNRPELPEKSAWVNDYANRENAKVVIERDWWKNFDSPALDTYIDQALAGDFDLTDKVLAVELAGIDITESRENLVGKVRTDAERTDNFEVKNDGAKTNTTNYGVNATVSWELDVWGKVRKGIAAKKAAYRASEADWRSTYLTVAAGVATKYFRILQLDEQREIQAQSLKTQQQLLAIYTAQYNEGLQPKSVLLSQRAEIASLEKERLDLERLRKEAELQLATLLGVPAGSIKVPYGNLTKSIKALSVPEGLPSDLLSRRPDILAAEYRVLQAHNLTGEARLARLPSFKLTGSAGLASAVLSNLLSSWTLGLAPRIDIPIFRPDLQRQVERSTIQEKQADNQYRRTVMQAFEEVETALLNLHYRKLQKQQFEEQIRNLRVVRDVQYAQLKEGLVSQLEVFDTDRSLLGAQQGLLSLHQQILSDTITLYKALGGGWPAEFVAQR